MYHHHHGKVITCGPDETSLSVFQSRKGRNPDSGLNAMCAKKKIVAELLSSSDGTNYIRQMTLSHPIIAFFLSCVKLQVHHFKLLVFRSIYEINPFI